MQQHAGAGTAPFAEAFAAWLAAARAELLRTPALAALAPAERDCFADAFSEDLGRRLGRLAAPSLFQVFDGRRQLAPLALLRDSTPDDVPTGAYVGFCDDMAGGGLATLLASHPPLRDRLHHLTQAAILQAAALAGYFRSDRDLWLPLLRSGRSHPPKLLGVQFGLSDEHAGGKTVARLDFEGDVALACKPRRLDAEHCFYRLLDWLGAQAGLPAQRIPGLASRADHGWMEWVAPAPCQTPADVHAYFQRLGVLMALLRVLRGGDIHEDNLVAAGAFPVIVDLECLFTPPRLPPGLDRTAGQLPLVESGLTPVMVPLESGAIRQVGGAGPPCDVRTVSGSGFRHPRTDWMRRATLQLATGGHNLPLLDGVEQDIRRHAAACVASYCHALEAVGRHAAQLAGPEGLLERWRPQHVRHLTSATENYQRMATWLAEPPFTQDRRRALRRAARLGRPAPGHAWPGAWRAMLRAERRALWRGDIPAFVADPVTGNVREAGGDRVGILWRHDAWHAVQSGLLQLDETQARHEAELLRRALDPASVATWRWPRQAGTTTWQATAQATVRALVDYLERQAVRHPEDGADWIRPHEDLPHTMQVADAGLYHGRAGIAVFLAAAHATGLVPAAGPLARAALHRLRRHVRAGGGADLLAAHGPGHADGVGGMIAALLACADLLDDAALLDDALALAHRLPPPDSAATDVHSGSAGLILSLAEVHRRRASPGLLAVLESWGHCLQAGTRCAAGGRSGLAHGPAGVAAAFAAVHRATGHARWQQAAAEALAQDAAASRAPPPGPRAGPGRHMQVQDRASWCQGAPGLALCHAQAPHAEWTRHAPLGLDGAAESAIRCAIGQGPGDLCCGDAGRLAVLLTLAQRSGDADRMLAAQAQVGAWVRRWPQDAPELWSDRLPDERHDICLFKGLAGVGYVLALALSPRPHGSILLPGVQGAGESPAKDIAPR